MKLDPKILATEPMKVVTFYLPTSIVGHIDRVAAKADVSCPNRSAWLRNAVLSALTRDQRTTEKVAA